MFGRPSIQPVLSSTDEQKNVSQANPALLTNLPDELLLMINEHLPTGKDKARLASVDRNLHRVFQPEIGKKEAKEAATYAITPTKDNIEKLKKLLTDCPALLLQRVMVANRHGQVINGTIYQIALHEGDNELIDDLIKPAFARLHRGVEKMQAQRQAWLPDRWIEAEERACASALTAIDKVFTAFKRASHPNAVTELPTAPYTITINHQASREALERCRKVIEALYQPTDKIIESGRDPIIRLLERVITRYDENYAALGGCDTPRNNVLLRAVYGYCQRFAPINFMQAFAQEIEFIVDNKEKLNRSFEYRRWPGHFIFPLDSDRLCRLGYECFGVGRSGGVRGWYGVARISICFINQKKQQFYTHTLRGRVKTVAQ